MTTERQLLENAAAAIRTATKPTDLHAVLLAIVQYLARHPADEVPDRPVSPCCGAPFMAQRSFNKKVCYDCGVEYPWQLKPGQKPLIVATR
jgi:hypothetical protein